MSSAPLQSSTTLKVLKLWNMPNKANETPVNLSIQGKQSLKQKAQHNCTRAKEETNTYCNIQFLK